MFLFVLFLSAFCYKTKGFWGLTYIGAESCDGMKFATKMTGDCFQMEIQSKELSMQYFCDDQSPFNVSANGYLGESSCIGTPVETHVGKSGVCEKAKGGNYGKLLCSSQYVMDFSSIQLGLPIHPDRKTDIGSETNPIVADLYFPVADCYTNPGAEEKRYVKITCDETTNDAEMKVYEEKLCLIPTHKIHMKPGEIINLSELGDDNKAFMTFGGNGDEFYTKYHGCKML